MADLEAAAEQWRTEGWALVEGLVPDADIEAVQPGLHRLFAEDSFDDYNRAKGFGNGDPEGRSFRGSKFDGMRGFPFFSSRLNDLFVHPAISGFARAALQDDDLRIYQAAVWGKWAGAVNYAQPLHTDTNHSVLPPRMEPGFWHLEGFLFLSDVDEGSAPPHLVPRSKSPAGTSPEELERHEVAAVGKRGSFLAYRSDVWHRGTDFTRDDASRFIMVISFRPAAADWFGYDALSRYGSDGRFSKLLAGKTPEQLSLFGIPRPGHPYWNEATCDAMAAKHPGLDLAPWRDALA